MSRRDVAAVILVAMLAVLALLWPWHADAETSWPQDRAFVFYNSGLSSDLLDSMAARFTFAIGNGDSDGADIDSLLARNDKFEWYAKYNSSTDNYVSGPQDAEHVYLGNADTLAAYGVASLESFYLHWVEDSIIKYGKSHLDTVPGWNPDGLIDPDTQEPYIATASSAAEARVKSFGFDIHGNDLNRRAVCFGDSNARRMMISWNSQELVNTTTPGGVQPKGLFLDNGGVIDTGVNGITAVISGGGVREAPNAGTIFSVDFKDWYYSTGAAYFRELYAFLEAHTDDIFGGVQRYSMPNVANIHLWTRPKWEQLLVADPKFAHMPLLEFCYSPWTHWPPSQPGTIHAKHKAAIEAGVGIFESGILKASYYPYTRDDEIEAQIAGYLVHRPYIGAVTDPLQKTWYLGMNSWYPGDNDGAPQPPFSHCLNPIFDIDLGLPLSDPYELAASIWIREYELGIAVVRHSVDGDTRVDDVVTLEPEIMFNLPTRYANYIPLDKSMAQGSAATSWTLGEGMGKVFLNGDPQAQGGHYGYLPLVAGTVDGTVTDTVMPVKLAKADLLEARADLHDIRFRTPDGTNLSHERALVSADSVLYWVLVPSLATGTEIRVYSGDDTLSTDLSGSGVWADYAGVYHCEEPPSNGTQMVDSGQENLRPDFVSTSGYPVWGPEHHVSGWFGSGYETQKGRGTTTPNIRVVTNWTISAWVNVVAGSGTDVLAMGSPYWWYAAVQKSNTLPAFSEFKIADGPPWPDLKLKIINCEAPDREWAKFDFVYTETPDTSITIYMNGEPCSGVWYIDDDPDVYPDAWAAPWYELGVDIDLLARNTSPSVYDPFGIACTPYLISTDQFNGLWDEYRIMRSDLSAAQVAAQYDAELDPAGWWSAGSFVIINDDLGTIPVIAGVVGVRNTNGDRVVINGTGFDTAQGLVALGNANTYDACTTVVNQPIEQWRLNINGDNDQIYIAYDTGTFTLTTPVWLYVQNEDLNWSNGFLVPAPTPAGKPGRDVTGGE